MHKTASSGGTTPSENWPGFSLRVYVGACVQVYASNKKFWATNFLVFPHQRVPMAMRASKPRRARPLRSSRTSGIFLIFGVLNRRFPLPRDSSAATLGQAAVSWIIDDPALVPRRWRVLTSLYAQLHPAGGPRVWPGTQPEKGSLAALVGLLQQ